MKTTSNKINVTSTTANRFSVFLGINGIYTAKALDDIYANRVILGKEKEFFDSVYSVVYTEEEYNTILNKYRRPRKVKEYSAEVKRARLEKEIAELKRKYSFDMLITEFGAIKAETEKAE